MKTKALLALIGMALTSYTAMAGELSSRIVKSTEKVEQMPTKYDFEKEGRRFAYYKIISTVEIRFHYVEEKYAKNRLLEDAPEQNQLGAIYTEKFEGLNFPTGVKARELMKGWSKTHCFSRVLAKASEMKRQGINVNLSINPDTLKQESVGKITANNELQELKASYACSALFTKEITK